MSNFKETKDNFSQMKPGHTFATIEKKINELEAALPLEIRVIFSTQRVQSPIGGLRASIVGLILAGLFVDVFWIPFPSWVFYILALLIVFAPAKVLSSIPLGRHFLLKTEIRHEMAMRAKRIFQELRMEGTESGNALLIFFCTTEHTFHILPDSRMELSWPESEWQKFSTVVSDHLTHSSSTNMASFETAILALLNEVEIIGRNRLGIRETAKIKNELENRVLIMDAL